MSTDLLPAPVIFGCSGLTLTDAERGFFAETNPLGFILFARNCESPNQVRALTASMRASVGRADAPILIDQEGGRVVRLRPPHWRLPPAAAQFAALWQRDRDAAIEAARWNARLMADDLLGLGIDVDCTPVLDLPSPDSHAVIGDRAYGADPESVIALGRSVCVGMLEGGVLPVLKHAPGHGRARVDSHLELPVVDAAAADLDRHDFVPFRALHDMPWAMTAHVVYTAIDAGRPATTSPIVIDQAIRRSIGFDGVLVSDDLGMKALAGSFAERSRAGLSAGCDIVLHCSGDMVEMQGVRDGLSPMVPATVRRLERAAAMRHVPASYDRAEKLANLNQWLA